MEAKPEEQSRGPLEMEESSKGQPIQSKAEQILMERRETAIAETIENSDSEISSTDTIASQQSAQKTSGNSSIQLQPENLGVFGTNSKDIQQNAQPESTNPDKPNLNGSGLEISAKAPINGLQQGQNAIHNDQQNLQIQGENMLTDSANNGAPVDKNANAQPNMLPQRSPEEEAELLKKAQEAEQLKIAKMKDLSERLRNNAAHCKPKKQLLLTPDIHPSDSSAGIEVIPPKSRIREFVKQELRRQSNQTILKDIKEEPNQEIQDENEEDDDEEEESSDGIDPELEKNPIAKACVDELKNEAEDPNLTDEEIEKKMYEKIVEMRLSEDLEEIKEIIKIITGQWRSGRLRHQTKETEEGLEKAFEGNASERKELEEKRKMRQQRKMRKIEERAKEISSQTISQLVERAMWIRAGQDPDALASDVLRGQIAMTSDRDPRKEVLERLEMSAFQREKRQSEALKERKRRTSLQKIEQSEVGNGPASLGIRASDIAKKTGVFSFVVRDKVLDAKKKAPEKKKTPTMSAPDEELAAFLAKG